MFFCETKFYSHGLLVRILEPEIDQKLGFGVDIFKKIRVKTFQIRGATFSIIVFIFHFITGIHLLRSCGSVFRSFVDPDPYSEYGSNWAQIQCFSIHNTVTFNVIIELSSFTGTYLCRFSGRTGWTTTVVSRPAWTRTSGSSSGSGWRNTPGRS